MKPLFPAVCLMIAAVCLLQADRDRSALAERQAELAALQEVRQRTAPLIEPEESQVNQTERLLRDRITDLEAKCGIVHRETPNPLTVPPGGMP